MQFVDHVQQQQIVLNGQEQLVQPVEHVFILVQQMQIVLNQTQFVEQQHTEHSQPVDCVHLQKQDSCVQQIGQEPFATPEQVLVSFLPVFPIWIAVNSLLFA